jgi:O-antigen polymerase
MNFFSKHIQFLYLFTLLAGTLFCIPEIFVNRFFTAPALWMQVGIVIGVLSFVLVKRKHILLPSCEFLAILLLWLIYFLWRQGLNVETAVSIVTNSLSLLLFYQILIKNSNKEKLFLAGSIIAVILCIWCVGQLLGWLPRYHNLFSATGPFDNPAGISASLALLLPFTLYQVENNKRWMRFICAIIVIAIVGCIIVLQARAAIIAAGVSTFVYGIRWLKTYTELKLSVIHYSLVALVAVLLFSGLYLLKKDSANGRLLIWRCSAELIAQKPLVGHGKNGFIANYMNEQADYFTRHPDSKYTILADNIRHPFNEYIKSIVEYGIIGFFLIVLLLFYPFYYSRKTSSKTAPAIRLSLLSIAICALFSYPLNYPSVRLMTVVLLASLLASGGERRMKLINGYFTKIIVLLLSSGLLCTTVYQTYNEREWHTVAHQSLRVKTRQMLPWNY